MSHYTTETFCPECGKEKLEAEDMRQTPWRDPHGFYYIYRCFACDAQFWNTGSKYIRLKPKQEYKGDYTT